jgi:hypothetical protein
VLETEESGVRCRRTECGALNRFGASYCGTCGQSLRGPDRREADNGQIVASWMKLMMIIGMVFLSIFASRSC